MSGTYALIVANSEYSDAGLGQLTAPGKDAESFARILEDKEVCGFEQVDILLNQPEYLIREAIYDLFNQKKPDDLLLLYFSGHGVRDEFGSLYLAVKNTNRSKLGATAVDSSYITRAMDQSRSKRQVLILDCCNSGAFAQGTKAATGVSIGTASAFQAGYGRIILTASDATQFAWEGDQVIGGTENSLFTHYLVEGLKGEADLNSDGCITVDELYDYAFEKVRFATPKQTPSKFSSKQQGEIILRQFKSIEEIKPISLSEQLISEMENTYPEVRLIAVNQLGKLSLGRNLGLARSAREALERLEKTDDSRRVSEAATHALEPIRQAEELERQKAEEQRVAAEKAEAERTARVEAERLLNDQKSAEAIKAREDAERLALQKAEEERFTFEKAEAERKETEERTRAAALRQAEEERIAKEKLAAIQQARREQAGRNAARRQEQIRQLRESGEAKWQALVTFVQSMPKDRSKLYPALGLGALLAGILAFLLFQPFKSPTLFFSKSPGGDTNIYSYGDGTLTQFTLSTDGSRNWEPAIGPTGDLYFTSDRTGKAEIFRTEDDGTVKQVTSTPGSAVSWAPALGPAGQLYFNSDRSGKVEIYRLNDDGTVQQVTSTAGGAASWDPALGPAGQLYFTSDRTGKAEIYRLKGGGTSQQVTETPGVAASWDPALGPAGQLYFTSNRTGKAEIYRLKSDGSVQQVTSTPASGASWAPVLLGNDIYFTSNRDGGNDVYLLEDTEAVQISSESWTGLLTGNSPLVP